MRRVCSLNKYSEKDPGRVCVPLFVCGSQALMWVNGILGNTGGYFVIHCHIGGAATGCVVG